MTFRQYFALDPPVTPLPKDVLTLMNSTMELVDLLYWRPVKSRGEGMNSDYGRALLGGHGMLFFPSYSQTTNEAPDLMMLKHGPIIDEQLDDNQLTQ